MTTFRNRFGEDKAKFKAYVKDMRTYNEILEKCLIAMAKAVQNDFMGKPITKVFTNKLTRLFSEDVATFDVQTSNYDNDKIIKVRVVSKGIKYIYDCEYDLRNSITFSKGTCTNDKRFTEESVNEIIKLINYNRIKVAQYEDAAKHFDKYVKAYNKAVNTFVRTMENINPIFADISKAQDMSYQCSGVKNIELWKWDNEFKKSVETYVLK